MPDKLRVIVLCLIVCCANSGCATILRGTTQAVEIVTIPPGAKVRAGDQEIVTPGKLILPRIAEHSEITITKDGHIPQSVQVSRQSTHKAWLNLLWFPTAILVGMATYTGSFSGLADAFFLFVGGSVLFPMMDYSSGAVYDLEPERIQTILESEAP
ncbi:MAG: hypothetical protein HY273_07200 [Gammaproteobacteria bacterium]|nr:hypothetical protein [Gammaproteobacteria bacterium]